MALSRVAKTLLNLIGLPGGPEQPKEEEPAPKASGCETSGQQTTIPLMKSIHGLGSSADGRVAVVQFEGEHEIISVGFPAAQLEMLGMLCFQTAEQRDFMSGNEPGLRVFDTASCTILQAHDGYMIITFEVTEGAKMSFRLGRVEFQEFRDKLAVLAGLKPTPAAQPRH